MATLRDNWARAALAVSIAAVLWFAVAALGAKFRVIPWQIALGAMTIEWGPRLLMAAAAIAFVGVVLAFLAKPQRLRIVALVALALPIGGLLTLNATRQKAHALPAIHDVTTDIANPPLFSERAIARRAQTPGVNSLDRKDARIPDTWQGAYAGARVDEAQAQAYPHIEPFVSDTGAADMFQIALETARAQPGWRIHDQDPAAGTIEAEAHTFWFGFVDDVVIRIRPLTDGSGSVVDVRSVSRVGLSDLGANAARIHAYLDALDRRVADVATGG